jgi:hypothetical protein
MVEGSDLHSVLYPTGEPPAVEEPVEKKQPNKARRFVGIALLALLSVGAAVVFTPGLRKSFLPQPPRAQSKIQNPRSELTPDPGPLPAVPVLWERLDLGAMPADVAQDLKSGKYYYDQRFPGNFGLAIGYWKQALEKVEAKVKAEAKVKVEVKAPDSGSPPVSTSTSTSTCSALVASAEGELARQFHSDSGDAVVLLKQGKREQAVILLEKMRADFIDITAPQYVWTSVVLSRRRRR